MTQEQLMVKTALHAWGLQIKRASQLFSALTDEQLLLDVAPGRNRGIYLLGHLTATHDAMNEILGLGERKYTQLDHSFLSNPDKAENDIPSAETLKQYWTDVNLTLSERFSRLPEGEWFKRHTKMTDEDFTKEPHRNKLSVLLSRTGHVAYHLGQLVFLKK